MSMKRGGEFGGDLGFTLHWGSSASRHTRLMIVTSQLTVGLAKLAQSWCLGVGVM